MPRTSRIDSNGIDGGIIFIRWQPQERQRKHRTAIHGHEHKSPKREASALPPLTPTSPRIPANDQPGSQGAHDVGTAQVPSSLPPR
jgi:hypothetical protein